VRQHRRRTRRCSRRRGHIGFSEFIAPAAPAAAERGRSAAEVKGVGIVVVSAVGGRELASRCWWLESWFAGMLAAMLDFLLSVLA
jgi:hypothetical protein